VGHPLTYTNYGHPQPRGNATFPPERTVPLPTHEDLDDKNGRIQKATSAPAGIQNNSSLTTPTTPSYDVESQSENKSWLGSFRNRKGRKEPRQHSRLTAESHSKRPLQLIKEILFSSWANLLLVFIPVGIALHFVNVSPTVVFVMNFLAIVPLAGVPSLPPPFSRVFPSKVAWRYTLEGIMLRCFG